MDAIEIIRHPELRNKPDKVSPRKPKWIRVKAPVSKVYGETRDLVSKLGFSVFNLLFGFVFLKNE